MSQDIIADGLNQIMNAKKAKKKSVILSHYSNLLLKVLELAKKNDYIKDYKTEGKKLIVNFSENLNQCNAIKPRYNVTTDKIEKYMRRYLPARGVGIMIVSTNKGLLTHEETINQNIGGCLIAYFY